MSASRPSSSSSPSSNSSKKTIWPLILVFAVIAVLAVGLVAIFYATSDVDRYRPMLEQKLSRALGNPVKIGGLQLAWSGGVAAEMRDVTVSESGRPVLEVKRAAMRLNPWALMSKKLSISSIEIVQPTLSLTRSGSGAFRVRGVNPPPASGASAVSDPDGTPGATQAKAANPNAMAAWTIFIQNIRLRDAVIAVRDESVRPPFQTEIRDLDADLKNVSLDGPIDIDAKAAVFSPAQNANLKAKVSRVASGRPDIKDLSLNATNLQIEQLVPKAPNGKPFVEGALGLSFEAAELDPMTAQKTLDGKLTVDLPKGLLLNLNIVQEILGQLESLFPGIVQNVEAHLPQSYKTRLTQQSTLLKPIRHEFPIRDGVVEVRDLAVETDFFAASLDGNLWLQGAFEGRGWIRLDGTFSNALFEGAPPIRILADAASRVQLPLIVRYAAGRFSILPDLEEIGRRLIPQSGRELLSQVLGIAQSAMGSQQSQQSQSGQPEPASNSNPQ